MALPFEDLRGGGVDIDFVKPAGGGDDTELVDPAAGFAPERDTDDLAAEFRADPREDV